MVYLGDTASLGFSLNVDPSEIPLRGIKDVAYSALAKLIQSDSQVISGVRVCSIENSMLRMAGLREGDIIVKVCHFLEHKEYYFRTFGERAVRS